MLSAFSHEYLSQLSFLWIVNIVMSTLECAELTHQLSFMTLSSVTGIANPVISPLTEGEKQTYQLSSMTLSSMTFIVNPVISPLTEGGRKCLYFVAFILIL